jgi:hypothetical protein
MYRNILTLLATAVVLASCSDRKKELTQTEIKAKVDSLVGVKLQDLARQSAEDLDRRMSIEIKAKADSIVAARTTGATTATNGNATSTTTTVTPSASPAQPALPAGER